LSWFETPVSRTSAGKLTTDSVGHMVGIDFLPFHEILNI
jgi:hypothetical protein